MIYKNIDIHNVAEIVEDEAEAEEEAEETAEVEIN